MLKKLMKFELRLFEKRLVGFYLFFIIFSLVMIFLPELIMKKIDTSVALALNEIMYIAYICAVFYIVLCPLIVGFAVYKRIMFSDDAYLLRTLPIKEHTFVISHIFVTYLVMIANLLGLWLLLSLSLTDNSSVSFISYEFVNSARDVISDVKREPVLGLVIAVFAVVVVLFVIITELCILHIGGCYTKKEKRGKYTIMIEGGVLLTVLMIILSRNDLYDTILLYTPVFAVLTIIQSVVVAEINHKHYNLS